ncbi:hypothetical protein BDK51DRAFT_49584 [Blyttiomyces helicus]|uniref:Uncharacterized protein n=1 Tax=Blyttiomyces helicus TaxID=388810 RepID=A0A4P9WGT4_9FUNG|nr:hypothetical protein BDK51DRAFT_49584 [Blyttiomyces helicus]|eukprot:RKO91043.1 hypothetical protein BDK51DRAFT_49584 [Blyttiomyces helicus]
MRVKILELLGPDDLAVLSAVNLKMNRHAKSILDPIIKCVKDDLVNLEGYRTRVEDSYIQDYRKFFRSMSKKRSTLGAIPARHTSKSAIPAKSWRIFVGGMVVSARTSLAQMYEMGMTAWNAATADSKVVTEWPGWNLGMNTLAWGLLLKAPFLLFLGTSGQKGYECNNYGKQAKRVENICYRGRKTLLTCIPTVGRSSVSFFGGTEDKGVSPSVAPPTFFLLIVVSRPPDTRDDRTAASDYGAGCAFEPSHPRFPSMSSANPDDALRIIVLRAALIEVDEVEAEMGPRAVYRCAEDKLDVAAVDVGCVDHVTKDM